MCLSEITKEVKPTDKIQEGYKLVRIKNDKWEGVVYTIKGSDPSKNPKNKFNKWYKSTQRKLEKGGFIAVGYETGFHVCKTKKGVEKWAKDTGWGMIAHTYIVKVKIKQVRIIGKQRDETGNNTVTTFVADQMMIPKEELEKIKK